MVTELATFDSGNGRIQNPMSKTASYRALRTKIERVVFTHEDVYPDEEMRFGTYPATDSQTICVALKAMNDAAIRRLEGIKASLSWKVPADVSRIENVVFILSDEAWEV
jgi:hypothetical protein